MLNLYFFFFFPSLSLFFFFSLYLFFLIFFYFTLQYCIAFAIHWHESTTGVLEFHPEPRSNLSLHIISLGHPSAPAPSILYPVSNLDNKCLFLWLSSSKYYLFSSVQFSHSVVSNSLQPHELQHARPPCPSPAPGVNSYSHPSSQWCHPASSFSVVPFSSCPQIFPTSKSLPMSQLFAWGGQSTGV